MLTETMRPSHAALVGAVLALACPTDAGAFGSLAGVQRRTAAPTPRVRGIDLFSGSYAWSSPV